MKKYWKTTRTLFLLIAGTFNTILIRPEDVGTWKNYLGHALLILGILDAIFLIEKHLKEGKYV